MTVDGQVSAPHIPLHCVHVWPDGLCLGNASGEMVIILWSYCNVQLI